MGARSWGLHMPVLPCPLTSALTPPSQAEAPLSLLSWGFPQAEPTA